MAPGEWGRLCRGITPVRGAGGGAGRGAEQAGMTLLFCSGFGKNQRWQLKILKVKEAGISN